MVGGVRRGEDGLSPETCLTKIWIVSSEEREREERRLEEVDEDIIVAGRGVCLGVLDKEGDEARRGGVRRWLKPVMQTASTWRRDRRATVCWQGEVERRLVVAR